MDVSRLPILDYLDMPLILAIRGRLLDGELLSFATSQPPPLSMTFATSQRSMLRWQRAKRGMCFTNEDHNGTTNSEKADRRYQARIVNHTNTR